MSRDRMDALGVAWHDSNAQKGERCVRCGEKMRKGIRILVERVLVGVNVHPLALHRNCWPTHLRLSERDAAKRRAERKQVDTPVPQA